jgi:Copper type II ascorbate-dependent monooxygenase, C-terminal domain
MRLKLFNLFLIPLMVLLHHPIFGQEKINFETNIKPILTKHCVNCHQNGGIAPFALDNWADVDARAIMIGAVTASKYMPPWRADTSFQHYKNENYLSKTEIELIQQWIQNEQPRGTVERRKEKLISQNKVKKKQGTEIQIGYNRAFVIKAENKEEFRFFHLPSKINENGYIQSIEFAPGNKKQVHHSRIMIDTTQSISGIDGLSEEDSSILKYQTKPLADPFLFGWVPGNDKIIFPKGIGKKIYANSDFIVNVHYVPSPIQVIDSSSIIIQLTNEPIEREAQTLTLTENNISNQPFIIYPNKKSTFYMRSPILQDSISLISIMPHMHLLGKSFKSYAITPDGNILPLVNVPGWDFNWQTTYQFTKFTVLPKGTVIYAEATYDNTNENPLNPYKPARAVGYGWGSKDEMMNLILYYVKYRQGDELIDL